MTVLLAVPEIVTNRNHRCFPTTGQDCTHLKISFMLLVICKLWQVAHLRLEFLSFCFWPHLVA